MFFFPDLLLSISFKYSFKSLSRKPPRAGQDCSPLEPESTCFLRRGQRHHSSKLPFLAPQVVCKEAQPHTHSSLTSGRSESSLLITYPVRGSTHSFSPSWVLTAALVQDLRGTRYRSGHFPCIISYSPQPSSDGGLSFPFCRPQVSP